MNNRISSIDFLKGISIIFIVILHSNPFLDYSEETRYFELSLDITARFAVPLFFLTSGYLLGKKVSKDKPNSNTIFWKYIKRLIKLYLVWSLIYFLYNISHDLLHIALHKPLKIDYDLNFKTIIDFIYYGDIFAEHLWFITALIFSVLIIWLAVNSRMLKTLVIVAIFLHLSGAIINYTNELNGSLFIRDAVFFGLSYTSIGFFYSYINLIGKIERKHFLYSLITVFFFIHLIEGLVTSSILNHNGIDYYISTLAFSFSIFLIVFIKKTITGFSFLKRLGYYSAGIYLLHLLIIKVTNNIIVIFGIQEVRETILFQISFTPYIILITYLIVIKLDSVFSLKHRGLI